MNDLVSIFLDKIEIGASEDAAMESVIEVLIDQIGYLLDAAQEDCSMVKKMTDIQDILTNITTEI